ncbi:MAG: hypothetical protein M0Z56_07535 [Desulfobacteraceae bacterium]|nr:hypothetical protein [Desulfobacteraceae bacterium]
MRNQFACLALALSLCVTCLPGMALGAEKAPVAVVEQSTFEFAPQFEGTDVVHDFVIKNKGNADLTILDVKAG